MADNEFVVTDGRKVTFAYERKVNLGNYESEAVSLYVTDFVPEDAENIHKWVNDHAEPAFANMKSEVWAALGLDYTFDEAGNPVLTQKPSAPPQPTSPPPQMAPPPQPAPQQALPQQFTPPPIAQPQQASGDGPAIAQPGYYADPPTFCDKCGHREFYDNRADNDQKIQQGVKIGPDFKCRSCRKGGSWRPGSFDYNKLAQSGGPQQQAPQAPPMPPGEQPF